MKVNENGRNILILGRSFTSRSQNFDVLSTFCWRKYGRLDVIRNPDCSTYICLSYAYCILVSYTRMRKQTVQICWKFSCVACVMSTLVLF